MVRLKVPGGNMDDKGRMLHHFLAALAYRTQKALRGAPDSFAGFEAGSSVRTPHFKTPESIPSA
jgi:hypothetical protein